VDIEPKTFNIDPMQAKAAVTSRTRAVRWRRSSACRSCFPRSR
jgi:hypothetical protein